MKILWQTFALVCAILIALFPLHAQQSAEGTEVRLRIVSTEGKKHHADPAVLWLEPEAGTPAMRFEPRERYTLLQKNRMFVPHLQVIPVGSKVQFPNADPFFHNVFSLFDGKRFDLGLYEAGTSKSVTFPREGVSYIFCNIHPEMSAVVITLSTPLFAIADGNDSLTVRDVPPGDYRLHLWIEGVKPSELSGITRSIHVASRPVDVGEFKVLVDENAAHNHSNEFGKPYGPASAPAY